MSVYLVFYLYQALSGHSGGPVVKIEAMPSIAVCEAVGAALKDLADRGAREAEERGYRSRRADFRCVVVGSAK